MKGTLYFTAILLLSLSSVGYSSVAPSACWQAPFDTTASDMSTADSLITLDRALGLVATAHPTLRALVAKREATHSQFEQAGRWPNPELATEFEEVGWDAPGFSQSEITVGLSQEFELFGQRGARKQMARAGIEATELDTRLSAYDLYLEVKERFYLLAHAQRQLELGLSAMTLAEDIVENISFRIRKGAALQSELLLAQLESQRAELAVKQLRQEFFSARNSLASLWAGEPATITVPPSEEPEFSAILDQLAGPDQLADSSREVLQLHHAANLARAERHLVAAAAKPSITLNGGFKRLRADGSNTFLVGVSLPLPLFDRNQGTTAALDAQLRSLEYEQQRARIDAAARIQAGTSRLRQLIERHATLDLQLLPTAEKAYHTLQQAYEAGQIPYLSLLEAERSLIDLRFEHNDMLASIHQQIIVLERMTGANLVLTTD